MSEIQTKRTSASVADYFAAIEDPSRRADCQAVAKLMEQLTKSKPVMWGPSIVGFGEREQLYANGKTATWMKIGFSSRKQNLVLYIMGGNTSAAQQSCLSSTQVADTLRKIYARPCATFAPIVLLALPTMA